MSLSNLKKELKNFDKESLTELITDLYKKDKATAKLIDYFLCPDEEAELEKYKAKIYKAFFPVRGYRFKLSEAKKAISDFKKLDPSTESLADIMFVYVETGVSFTLEYGDISEAFYFSLSQTYGKALILMEKEGLLSKFEERARKILSETEDIGWGFQDDLSDVYYQFFDE